MYLHHKWTKTKKPTLPGRRNHSLTSSCCQHHLSYVLCQVLSHDVHGKSTDLHVAEKPLHCPYFFKQIFSSPACTWLWDSPQRGSAQAQPACAGAPGKQGTSYFPAWQNTGWHGVEGKGKSEGLCNTACSLCSSLPLKILSVWSQVKNNSPLSPPSRAAANFLRCNAKPEAAKQNEACKDLNSFSQAQSTLMPTSEAIQTLWELRATGLDIFIDKQYFNPLSFLVGVTPCHGLYGPVFLTSAT